eukprot:TRINITY_DN30934_c0_g1_i1.p1 TRINITY_DN30934_c0_g1~~TRINITY_DN30934_c0_g1_i1.p1  ORF type:complete len:405 (+),score=73.95 TRINITY_DN30934_c0_g1_i1:54-1217(+)
MPPPRPASALAPPPLPSASFGKRKPPAAAGRQPGAAGLDASGIRLRCGGAVHSRGVAADDAGDAERSTFYAGLVNTNPDSLHGPVFGPDGLVPLTDQDHFVDLGCGEGKALLAARAYCSRCRCTGIEIDAKHVAVARSSAERALAEAGPDAEPIRIIHGSIDDDEAAEVLAEATVVYVFLCEWANLKLRPKLVRLLPVGAAIVTRTFSMGDWQPDAETFGAEGRTPYRKYLVTAARKADATLQSDEELARRFGLRWIQPPPGNYRAGSQQIGAAAAAATARGGSSSARDSAAVALAGAASMSASASISAAAARLVPAIAASNARASGPRPFLGWSMVLGAVFCWVSLVYMTLSQRGGYFCLLAPLLLPTFIVYRYWGWYSMELFKNA